MVAFKGGMDTGNDTPINLDVATLTANFDAKPKSPNFISSLSSRFLLISEKENLRDHPPKQSIEILMLNG